MLPMDEAPRRSRSIGLGLSAQLLVLTTLFVMLAEVLIFVPSISRFREVWLRDALEKANIAVLAAQASPDDGVAQGLTMDLLFRTGAYAIILHTPDRRMLMVSGEMPPATDITVDMRTGSVLDRIVGAFGTLAQSENRILRVVDAAPDDADGTLEMLLDEAPLRLEMYAYSWRILTLSVIISLITAGLVFISLRCLLVRPIRRMTLWMMAFRENPEDESVTPPPSRRRDEIGIAQRELAVMQSELRAALRQREHLAALGGAVARINHDLRNTLATAVLVSDRLATIEDPEVQRVAPRLFAAMDRAIRLCEQTLTFIRDPRRSLRSTSFPVGELVSDLEGAFTGNGGAPTAAIGGAGHDTVIEADREQLARAIANLALNARKAGARTIRIDAHRENGRVIIDVADDGPGIPDAIREVLFRPFESAGRNGGTGLGLAIAREIVHAHGGDLVLDNTGPDGTTFRMDLPAAAQPRRQHGG